MNSDPGWPGLIREAVEILRRGGLVAFPTETVYGLGANALDLQAVARVFEAKERPRFDPLIVHVADRVAVEPLVTAFSQRAQLLADRFWPGPLTLVLPKSGRIPDLVTSGAPTVAVRIPDHPLALDLLRAVNLPIAAPSANPFGRISPTTAEHVRAQLGDRIDLILDGGPCRVGVESTVIQVTDSDACLLRPGGVTLEEIEAVIGTVRIGTGQAAPALESPDAAPAASTPVVSPGLLAQHYAPRTRLVLAEAPDAKWMHGRAALNDAAEFQTTHAAGNRRIGLLASRPVADGAQFECIEVLSATGDLRESAANFFAALRRLDAAGLDLIVGQLFPEAGLGRALNDRLRRASAR